MKRIVNESANILITTPLAELTIAVTGTPLEAAGITGVEEVTFSTVLAGVVTMLLAFCSSVSASTRHVRANRTIREARMIDLFIVGLWSGMVSVHAFGFCWLGIDLVQQFAFY
jgi:uncharacterized paraquat-inducible protein A